MIAKLWTSTLIKLAVKIDADIGIALLMGGRDELSCRDLRQDPSSFGHSPLFPLHLARQDFPGTYSRHIAPLDFIPHV